MLFTLSGIEKLFFDCLEYSLVTTPTEFSWLCLRNVPC